MAKRFNGKISLDVRDSEPDWEPYLAPKAPEGAPNVLLLAWDDLGFATMDVYGGPVECPNMRRIAERGVQFSNFHTTALCSPTRASLLTGRNATTNGMATIAEFASGFPGISTRIPFESGFVSEVLAEHGYNTYCVGKWHLTPGEECNLAAFKGRWPLGRGFERFYGWLGGETNSYYPDLVHDNHPIEPPGRPEDGYHLADDMADRAVQFIQDAKVIDPDKPFFMYLAPQAGHAPHLVPNEWADRYEGRFDDGYEAIRAGILARQIELGILPEGTELSPINPHGEPERTGPDGQPWPQLDTVRPWDTLGDDEKRLFSRMMEVFAGYISYYDDRLGRVLDHLEESGQIDNTLIIVVSDNGASGEGGPNGSFNEWRFFNGVPDTTETTMPHIDELGTPASNNHYNTGWAWALDTPFPYWKRWAGEEGGTADMLLVSWPAKIPASREIRHQYTHAVDVVPTIYDLLGIEPPDVIRGYPQLPIEGESFAAALTDPSVPGKATQFYTMLGQRALYHEGWLATTVHPPLSGWGDFMADEWELFHLEADRSQSKNVAAEHPRRLELLKDLWFYYAGIYNGLPLDDRSAPRTGPGRAAARGRAPRPVRLLPGRVRRARVGGPVGQRPLLHGRGRGDRRLCRRGRGDLGGRWRAGRPQPLRQGRPVALHVQLDRHEAPGRGGRPVPHPRAARVHRRVRGRRAQCRSGHARHGGHPHPLRRRPGRRLGSDRHPARLLLPDRRRHLRRP
ncbi:MAG: arylsulfatase [Acidimicrobiales bacterium]